METGGCWSSARLSSYARQVPVQLLKGLAWNGLFQLVLGLLAIFAGFVAFHDLSAYIREAIFSLSSGWLLVGAGSASLAAGMGRISTIRCCVLSSLLLSILVAVCCTAAIPSVSISMSMSNNSGYTKAIQALWTVLFSLELALALAQCCIASYFLSSRRRSASSARGAGTHGHQPTSPDLSVSAATVESGVAQPAYTELADKWDLDKAPPTYDEAINHSAT